MARYVGPSCKLCRSANTKLFLKGDRCYTNKCALERRTPKVNMRRKQSEYGLQLKEKQKLKRTYGLLESQFFNYYKKALKKSGITGDNLLEMLERRLDNVVYRLGLAKSRSQARQFVSHGHILINSKRVDIPSYQVSEGEVISVHDLKLAVDNAKDIKLPSWLSKTTDGFSVDSTPESESVGSNFNAQMVVEFYSR